MVSLALLSGKGSVERLVLCPVCLPPLTNLMRDLGNGTVHTFHLFDCVEKYYRGDEWMTCDMRHTNIAWSTVLPDCCLSELSDLNIAWDPAWNHGLENDVLGRGGEGTVFRAEFQGESVAVKCSTSATSLLSKLELLSIMQHSGHREEGDVKSYVELSVS